MADDGGARLSKQIIINKHVYQANEIDSECGRVCVYAYQHSTHSSYNETNKKKTQFCAMSMHYYYSKKHTYLSQYDEMEEMKR